MYSPYTMPLFSWAYYILWSNWKLTSLITFHVGQHKSTLRLFIMVNSYKWNDFKLKMLIHIYFITVENYFFKCWEMTMIVSVIHYSFKYLKYLFNHFMFLIYEGCSKSNDNECISFALIGGFLSNSHIMFRM